MCARRSLLKKPRLINNVKRLREGDKFFEMTNQRKNALSSKKENNQVGSENLTLQNKSFMFAFQGRFVNSWNMRSINANTKTCLKIWYLKSLFNQLNTTIISLII